MSNNFMLSEEKKAVVQSLCRDLPFCQKEILTLLKPGNITKEDFVIAMRRLLPNKSKEELYPVYDVFSTGAKEKNEESDMEIEMSENFLDQIENALKQIPEEERGQKLYELYKFLCDLSGSEVENVKLPNGLYDQPALRKNVASLLQKVNSEKVYKTFESNFGDENTEINELAKDFSEEEQKLIAMASVYASVNRSNNEELIKTVTPEKIVKEVKDSLLQKLGYGLLYISLGVLLLIALIILFELLSPVMTVLFSILAYIQSKWLILSIGLFVVGLIYALFSDNSENDSNNENNNEVNLNACKMYKIEDKDAVIV